MTSLDDSHFFHPGHSAIWIAILGLRESDGSINCFTVKQAIKDAGKFEEIGGDEFFDPIFDFISTAFGVLDYAATLIEKSRRRKAIAVLSEATREMYELEPTAVNEALIKSIQETRGCLDSGGSSVVHIKHFASQAVENIETLYKNKGAIIGVPTGFQSLDNIFGGLKGGNFVIVAARPSIGKSALGMNIAENAAVCGFPVGVFTLEMSGCELVTRMVCAGSKIGMRRVRDGQMSSGDFRPMGNTASRVSGLPIFIEEKPAITITELRSKCRTLKNKNDIGLIVIDYIGLMRSMSKRAQGNRQIEISEISAGLKEMAKELDIPVIALAQLNRDIEKRKDGRPQLSDLRESGSLEQDADIVILLHRAKEQASEEAFAMIAKHRNGEIGGVKLWWDGPTTSFKEITD
jgi:replicative DNA helicase